MWRCLNDIHNYCSGEPNFNEMEQKVESGTIQATLKSCNSDPKTCGKHQLFSEQVDSDSLGQLTGNSYKRIVATVAESEKVSKKKASSKPVQEETLL